MNRTPLRRRDADRSRRRGLIPALAVTALLLLAGSAALIGPELASATGHAEQVSRDDAALVQVTDLRTAVADWQVYFEPLIVQAGPVDTAALTDGALLAQKVLDDAAVTVDALAAVGLTGPSGEVATARAAFEDALTALAPVATNRADPEALPLLAAEQRRVHADAGRDRGGRGAVAREPRRRPGAGRPASRQRPDEGSGRRVARRALFIVVSAVVFGTRARRQARAAHGPRTAAVRDIAAGWIGDGQDRNGRLRHRQPGLARLGP